MHLSCLRIFVADSQPVFRAGIVNALCSESDIHVVGETGSADLLIDAIGTLAPDVAVVDGMLLDRGVLAQLDEACQKAGTRMLVIAPPWSAPCISMLAAGLIVNCVLRAASRQELVDALRKVGKGERFVHAAVDEYLQNGTPDTLTVHELSVLALAAEGHSNSAIAGQLRVSLPYVNTQVRRLLQKLNARDRTHAVILGLRHGLLEM